MVSPLTLFLEPSHRFRVQLEHLIEIGFIDVYVVTYTVVEIEGK